jgi:ketosteroid isomerase-like protein
VTLAHEELFKRYLYAGAITRNADAVAALFTEDGVYEAPLAPGGLRLAGRDAIREGIGAMHRDPAYEGKADSARSAFVLHETGDPAVFIAEIDAALENGPTMSMVQIFRVRDGRIAHLRDYFRAPAT